MRWSLNPTFTRWRELYSPDLLKREYCNFLGRTFISGSFEVEAEKPRGLSMGNTSAGNRKSFCWSLWRGRGGQEEKCRRHSLWHWCDISRTDPPKLQSSYLLKEEIFSFLSESWWRGSAWHPDSSERIEPARGSVGPWESECGRSVSACVELWTWNRSLELIVTRWYPVTLNVQPPSLPLLEGSVLWSIQSFSLMAPRICHLCSAILSSRVFAPCSQFGLSLLGAPRYAPFDVSLP